MEIKITYVVHEGQRNMEDIKCNMRIDAKVFTEGCGGTEIYNRRHAICTKL